MNCTYISLHLLFIATSPNLHNYAIIIICNAIIKLMKSKDQVKTNCVAQLESGCRCRQISCGVTVRWVIQFQAL